MVSAAAVPAGAHPPVISLANFEERKEEITQQLMHAATTSGKLSCTVSRICA